MSEEEKVSTGTLSRNAFWKVRAGSSWILWSLWNDLQFLQNLHNLYEGIDFCECWVAASFPWLANQVSQEFSIEHFALEGPAQVQPW